VRKIYLILLLGDWRVYTLLSGGKEIIILGHDPRNTKMNEEKKFRGKVAKTRWRGMIF
jgi:hypothetical protein